MCPWGGRDGGPGNPPGFITGDGHSIKKINIERKLWGHPNQEVGLGIHRFLHALIGRKVVGK